MQNNDLIKVLRDFNVDCSDFQCSLLMELMSYTLEKNKVLNLTNITLENDFINKMIIDSALSFNDVDLNNKNKCIDVGTGGGFPGLVLAILYPYINFTLLDSTLKKCVHVKQCAEHLNLNNVTVVNDRVENFIIHNRSSFDLVTARAVSSLNMLLELCMPLLKQNGVFIALKGKAGLDELKESKEALKKLNTKLINCFEYNLKDDSGTRMNFHFNLDGEINKKYPRSYKEIKHRPL